MDKKIAFFPGSFDPVTLGHLFILFRALNDYDQVIVGIGINPDKKHLFTPQQRLELFQDSLDNFIRFYNLSEIYEMELTPSIIQGVQKIIADPGCCRIQIYEDVKVTAFAALQAGAHTLIRGYRDEKALDEEQALAKINKEIVGVVGQKMDTAFYKTYDQHANISSSRVKGLCKFEQFILIQNCVTDNVNQALMEKCLKTVFFEIAPSFGYHPQTDGNDREIVETTYNQLVKAYMPRCYYNLTHVAYCLNLVQIYKDIFGGIEDYNLLRAAIFWHDAADSELGSVALGMEFLQRSSNEKKTAFKDLIMATAHFKPEQSPLDTLEKKLIHDVDMAILGDTVNYGKYVQRLYLEYPDSNPIARIGFLNKCLKNGLPYKLSFFQDLYRASFFRNINQEITLWTELME